MLVLSLVFTFFVLDSDARAFAQSTSRLNVIQSDAHRVVVELELDSYSARAQRVGGTIYTALSVPEFGSTGERGKPQMPVRGAFIGVPPGAQPTLKILADDVRSDALARPPLPVPTPRVSIDPRSRFPRDLGDAIIPNAAAYASNQNYPADVARITSVGDWRSQHFAVVEFHPLQYNAASWQLLFHRRVRVEITLSYPRGVSAQTLGGAVNEGAFETVFQKSILNYASAKNWRARSAPRLSAQRAWAPSSTQTWYKLGVNADGIYQVTCSQLQSAGVNPLPNPSTFQIFKQGVEVAINVVGAWSGGCASGDYIEFFGEKANTKYADPNVYWLTFGTAAGKRMLPRDGTGSGAATATFTDTLRVEKNSIYISMYPALADYPSPANENYEHWYWDYVSQAYGKPSADFPFALNYLATASVSATVQVNLVGYQPANESVPVGHYTRVYINSHPDPIGEITWSGSVTQAVTFAFPQSYLNVGANTIRVNEPNSTSGDLIYVDSFNLRYTRPFSASNDALRFRQSAAGPWQYQLTGFTSSNIELFDITDPSNVASINGTITPGSPYSTLQFADASAPPREYIALTTAQRKTPTLALDAASNLRSGNNRADYLIIAHGDFVATVQALRTFRETQQLYSQVVNVQDVYDEFNYGVVDPQAIRDFLAYAYANWTGGGQWSPPSYVLLVGDGTYDPKEYCATGCWYTTPRTLIPPFLRMVDPWLGETASDNRFVAFFDGAGNLMPQMHIGRLPANNVSEASAMVTKILNYEQSTPGGAWRSTVSFVADSKYKADGNIDEAGDFWAASDELYDNVLYTPASLAKERIYYNLCPACPAPYPTYTTATDAENAINSAINTGRVIVNYVGHGSYIQWSNYPAIFSTADVPGLGNGNKLPVMLEMTCMTGYFHEPSTSSLAETNVRAAGKGALASWAPTGWGLVNGHSLLHKGFLDAVMNQSVRQLGPATTLGKAYLWANSTGFRDLIDTYALLGDPASRMQIEFRGTHFFPFIRRQ